MKEKRGITLIVLTVTIVVLVILATTIVYTGSDLVNDTKKSEFAKEIYTIKTMLKEYNFREGKYPVVDKIDISLSSFDSSFVKQFSNESGYSSGTISLSEIDLYELGVDNISRGTGETLKDKYFVSEETGNVYYLEGEKYGKNIYYTLTDELKGYIGK